jgi:arylformamidase
VNRWIDVTVPLCDGMVHWPGDPPVMIERLSDVDRGDPQTLTTIRMSAHTGTHMDAPIHYIPGGKGIDEFPPEIAVGPARVIACGDARSIGASELRRHRIRRGERILLQTANSARQWHMGPFIEDYAAISLDGALFLAGRGVRLVGVDYLSVGGPGADGVQTHIALLEAGIWLIEGLDLSRVAPGRHAMICLPLRIPHGDGAPARVFLRPQRPPSQGNRPAR